LLLIDTSIGEVFWILITSLLGILSFAGSLEGYFVRENINIQTRIILALSSLCLIIPNFTSDLLGLAGMGTVVALMILKNKRKKIGEIIT
jgi:TRAP-type uncharacterized transport system fused permease subunit